MLLLTKEGSSGDRTPGEGRVLVGLLLQIVDDGRLGGKDGTDLLAILVGAVTTPLAGQETLDTGLDGGVDDRLLIDHAEERRDDGILAFELLDQLGFRVVGLDDLDVAGEGGVGLLAAEGGDVELAALV